MTCRRIAASDCGEVPRGGQRADTGVTSELSLPETARNDLFVWTSSAGGAYEAVGPRRRRRYSSWNRKMVESLLACCAWRGSIRKFLSSLLCHRIIFRYESISMPKYLKFSLEAGSGRGGKIFNRPPEGIFDLHIPTNYLSLTST